jgi:hypothetical protein
VALKSDLWLYNGWFVLLILVGCASTKTSPMVTNLPPSTVENVQYYPRFLKGYEGSYPLRPIMVLRPVDDREFPDRWSKDHQPLNGDPAIGVVLNSKEQVIERLYAHPFIDLVQKALADAASEAGMNPVISNQSSYESVLGSGPPPYVLASRIKRCWVEKKLEASDGGPGIWRSWAEFDLEATIYKVPFRVPFWQTKSVSVFYDPPPNTFDPGLGSETALYENSAEVLSVALTRAIAGIFNHYDLRTLITQDRVLTQ